MQIPRLQRFTALLIVVFSASLVLSGASERKITLGGPVGLYTVAQWKKGWPGCGWQDGVEEGNLSRVVRDGRHCLRVNYHSGRIGPEDNGCGWRFPVGTRETAELRYTVRFSPQFDWVKGGKLPGLCGGPRNVSGGRPADGLNGFSARLMWRTGGRGEAYLYHMNQPDRYGDRVAFPEDFRFPTDSSIRIRIRVTMNDPGRKNGKVQIWIQAGESEAGLEVEVVHRTDLEWRSTPAF